jgi:hypothetical protein
VKAKRVSTMLTAAAVAAGLVASPATVVGKSRSGDSQASGGSTGAQTLASSGPKSGGTGRKVR